MKNFRLYSMGRRAPDSDYIKGKIHLTNRIALVVLISGLISGTISLIHFNLLALLPFSGIVAALVVIFLNRFGYHKPARIILSFAPLLLTSLYHAYLIPAHAGYIAPLYLAELAFALNPWLLFGLREKKLLFFSVFFNGVILVVQYHLNLLLESDFNYKLFLTGYLNPLTLYGTLVIAFMSLYFFLHRTYAAENQHRDLLEENRALLAKEQKGRLKAESALQHTKSRAQKYLDMAGNMIVALNTHGDVEMINTKGCEILSCGMDEILGKNWFDHFIPEKEIPRIKERLRNIVQFGVEPSQYFENPVLTQNGETRLIKWKNSVLKDEQGEVFKILSSGEDITEKRLAEEELIILATAIDQVEEDIIITDLNGQIRYVNPAFERITEYSKEEVIGKNTNILKSGVHEDQFYQQMWEALNKGKIWHGKMTNATKNGRIIIQDTIISPIRDATGKKIGYVSTRRDITNQLKLETQLLQAQKMEAMGSLAGGISHDFNNILAGIMGSLEILQIFLKKENLTNREKIFSFVDISRESGKRAVELIKQLLILSRKQAPQFTTVDLNEALLSLEKIAENSFPKSVIIQTHYYPEPAVVQADIVQIEQVLLNLCVNASHAMTIMRAKEKQGGILSLSVAKVPADDPSLLSFPELDEESDYYKIQVTDSGVGMDEATMTRIFNPFFSTKDKENGTGLGLSTAYSIVKSHHGFITVSSQISHGSTFAIYLPESETPLKPLIETEHEEDILIHGSGEILIIDDEPNLLKIIGQILGESGYSVNVTSDPVKGVSMFKKKRHAIKAIILDLSMPGMDGLEVYKQIKSVNNSIKIIITSGQQDERLEKLKKSGIDGFLKKPYSGRRLTELLRKILE